MHSTSLPGLNLEHFCLSDKGCCRPKNEDAVGFFPGEGPGRCFLLVIADGVGGNVAGEVASQLAVDTVLEHFFAQGEPADVAEALDQALNAANRMIYQEGMAHPHKHGMATTCTAAVIRGRELTLGHVGDCRAYLARPNGFAQLTLDHSVAAEYERQGTPLPPEKQVLANVLTRWLGTDEEVQVDISHPINLDPHSSLVLCTDGLTKVVTPPEIHLALTRNAPEAACRELVDLALERGGPDNVTVQIARLSPA